MMCKLAIWFIVAVTAWWLLPKSWDGGEKVARRRPVSTSASLFASSSASLNDVAAAAQPSRDELLRRAEADPLTVRAYKRIDEIREGDLVVALDEDSGELVARPVTRLFRSTSDHLREVKYQTADGEERKLETTGEHPFWTARGGWTPAKELQPGDVFRQANGDAATLLATLYVEEPDGVAVYNFEVDGAHNYFVAAPNTIRGPPDDFFAESRYADTLHGNALLVHNRCTTVYRHVDDAGKVRYVGISYASAFAARTSYHRRVNKFDVVKLFDVATRRDARAVEQALINLHVLGRKGGSLLNKINSISPTRKWYDDALKRGMDILRANGYKHPGLL